MPFSLYRHALGLRINGHPVSDPRARWPNRSPRRRRHGRACAPGIPASSPVEALGAVSRVVPPSNTHDDLLSSLEALFPDQVPTLHGVDALSDTNATQALRILSRVHLRTTSSSRVLLGHYGSLTPSLINTLPQHCLFLSSADLAEVLLACSNLCQPPRASKGSKLEAAGDAITAAARQQTTDVLLPHVVSRLTDQAASPLLASDIAQAAYALSQLPPDIRQSSTYAAACQHIHAACAAAALQMTARDACSVIICGTAEALLMPSSSRTLASLLTPLCIVDSSRLHQFLTPRMQLQLLWSLHEFKLRHADQYQAAANSVDIRNLAHGLTRCLASAFADRSRRWDAKLIHHAIKGAVLLRMRAPWLVRGFAEHALGRGAPPLDARTALALTDLTYGAQRNQRQQYDPDPRTRSVLTRALTHAAAARERRWTAFECWQICRMLPHLHPGVSAKDFTHVTQHTVWAEHTQRGQGTLAWEAVFTNCKTFVSRMHALQRSRAPRGVRYSFCAAAAELPGFFDDVESRDTVTMLSLLIHCTGLDDVVTVMLDAALRHAQAGKNMAYAVYAAAKLQRPEYIRPLCAALEPSIPDMNAQDVNHLVWAAATCRIKDGINFAAILVQLQLLLEAAAGEGDGEDAGGLEGEGEGWEDAWEPAQAAALPPLQLSGWQVAQVGWSLAQLKVEGSEDMLRLLIDAVREEMVLKPIDMTNLLWAAAMLRVDIRATRLWARTRAVLAGPLRGWRAKELCSCLWSLGLMRLSPGHHALEGMIGKLEMHVNALPLQHVVNSMSGLARLNHMPPRGLLEFIEDAVVGHLMQSDAQDLSRALHLFTHLAYEPRRLLDALEGGLPHTARLLSRDMHTSVKVLMCIATFNAARPRLHAWTLQALSAMPADAFSGSLMQQVIQAHMLAQADGMPSGELPEFVVSGKREALAASINIERSWNRALLANIKAVLEERGHGPARFGATVTDGVVHIDLLLEALAWGNKPVALELLDAQHVACNTGQPLGRWLLRRRLLETFGFHVVTVAEDAWLAAPAPADLLATLLADCRRVPHTQRVHRQYNRITFVETVYYADVSDGEFSKVMQTGNPVQ
eukprot:jgi/Ulvmu1/548/UM001_0556.1